MFSFFRRNKKTRKSRPAAQKRRFVRRLPLYLEVLESRVLLSADNWIGGSGSWDTGSNWSLGKAPGSGDTAIINTASAATITIQSGDNINVQSITTGSNDTLAFTGGSLTVTSGTSTLGGALSMSGGSLGATGAGVSLTANGTTTIADASLYAENGATLSLPQMTSYTADGNTFEANGANSVLDVSALTTTPTIKGNWSINTYNGGTLKLTGLTSLAGDSEGTIYINDSGNSTLDDSNVSTLSGVNANIANDANVANSWTKFTNGQLTVSGGSYSLSKLTDVDDSNLDVNSGASLALPNLVSYTANGNTFQSENSNSVLDLSALTTPTIKGSWSINAYNGGTLKLTGLTSLSSNSEGTVYINDTGSSTLDDSNVTTLSGVNANIANDAQVANSWTKFLNGSLYVSGGSYSLSKLTDVDQSGLHVTNGGSLALPGLVSYVANGTFSSDGSNSVLDVSALTTVTFQGGWSIQATAGGEIKLTGMTALNSSSQGTIYITDIGNSTLDDSNVATLNGVVANIANDAQVANSWTKFTNGTLDVTGGSYSLSKLTDVDQSGLHVTNGGSLALPGLVSYVANGTFSSDGSNSVLDVSALTTVTFQGGWSIQATAGGTIKLTGMTALNSSSQGTVYITDTGNSTLDDSNVATLDGVNATLDGTDANVANSWTQFTNGTLTVTGGSMSFPQLTDFSGSSLRLSGGAALNFPVLTKGNITLTNGTSVTIQGTTVSDPADGTSGATINVPSSNGLTITLQNSGSQGLSDTTFNVGQGSTVALNSGTYLGTTTFNVAQNATVDLTGGGSTTYGGILTGSGAGTVLLSGGRFNPTGGTNGLTLNFAGNMFQWTGGAMFASLGDVVNTGTMNLAGSNDKGFYEDATLTNEGTIIQTGTGNLGLHSDNVTPTTLINAAGASYLIEGDGGFDNPFGGQVAVSNAGTIKKTSGTGTSTLYINGSLSNTGVIEADSGTLLMDPSTFTQISNGTLTAGTWNAVNGASLLWGNTTAGEITDNAANVTISGSGADGNASFNLFNLSTNSGSFTISDGFNDSQTADFTNSASLTVGAGSTFSFGGSFTQNAAGTLNVQLGGTPASGDFGQIAVAGTATLGGALNVSLVNGFTPSSGQDFKVMTYASASGTFATVTGLGSALTESVNPTSLDLTSTAANPVDLDLTSVTAPTAASTGQPITVNWTVSNSSSNAATGSWMDSVFLSTTPTITGSSVLLGSVTHTGSLAANASYNASLTAPMPALLPGDYYVLVQTDSHYQEPDSNRSNNVMASSSGQLTVSVPSLTLGTATNGTFTTADQDQYYQVTVPAGGALQISLTSAATSGALALYVSQGTQPTPYSFQESANLAGQPNQSLNVPVIAAGTYYILVHSISGAAATAGYTLNITQTNGLSVSGISSYPGGNGGNVTVEIDGTNFTPQTTASLTLGSATINASTVYYMSATQLYATFNLSGATPGGYTLSVQQGTQTATAASKFQVIAAKPNDGVLWLTMGNAPDIRAGRSGAYVISYTNKSHEDIVAPLLEVSTTNPNIAFSTPDDPNYWVMSAQLLAVASSGPAGIIRPGQSGQLTVDLHSYGTGGNPLPLSVKELAENMTVGWDQLKSSSQPSGIPDAAWNVIWNNFTSTAGNKVGSYEADLANAATYLGSLGESTAQVSDVTHLWGFLVAQSDAFYPSPTLTSAVDAALPTPGSLPLAIDRTFQSTISGRYTPGIFGLGWTTSWQTSLNVVDPDSQAVTINSGGGAASFIYLPNGTYVDVAGEYGALTKSGSIYTYTGPDGTKYVFLANGNLNYEQDTDGNRITLGYNAQNQIVSLTYSNPADSSEPTAQLTLTYNKQGFVSQTADGTGNTWSYNYDSTGHLLSVTGPGNLTTSYTYDTGSNPETANALLSITNPDGSLVNFTYDSATGRLTNSSQNGGVNSVTYTYPGEGEVTTTDSAGDKSTVWFNDQGLAALVEDPLGGISTGTYDSNGNLTGYTDAAGDNFRYSYDTNGNLTQIVNPLGQTVKMTYGPLDTLTSITDPGGNTTQYKYDSAGNLLSIAYPDGTKQSFTYDPLGNLSETVLQNGDPIDYQYNAQGSVSKAAFADGSSQTFTYDAQGNLLSANTYNSSGTLTGTTTLTYNAINEVLSVTYPNGQFLKFTYNAAGQRTQSVDQSGYTINYTYDTLGRLSELIDGSGNLIVQYSYNNIGELVKKVNGNGTYTTYAYDAAGDLTQEVNYADSSGKTVNSSFTYTYNVLGEQTSVTDASGNVTKYGYDAIGQLTQVTLPDGTSITYNYNAAGDRTEVLTNGTPINYTSNADNEITQAGSTAYTYDANGNLKTATDSSGTTTYTYNDLNQLVSITSPDGSVQTFQYSPLGFLVGTSTTSGGTTSQTNYLVDPTGMGNVVASYDGSGSLIAHYNYGLGLVSQTGPSGTGYYDFDANGNTIGIIGSSGTYVNQYSYLPFGETTTIQATLPNPFTFAGQVGVMQIGSNLFNMRARDYTPATGQFLSNDPIGLKGGDPNIRRYVGNGPTGAIDPSGLDGDRPDTPSDDPDWPPGKPEPPPVVPLGLPPGVKPLQETGIGPPTGLLRVRYAGHDYLIWFNLESKEVIDVTQTYQVWLGWKRLWEFPHVTGSLRNSILKEVFPSPLLQIHGKLEQPQACGSTSGNPIPALDPSATALQNMAADGVTFCTVNPPYPPLVYASSRPGSPPPPPPTVYCTNAKPPNDTGPSFNCSSDTCGGGSDCSSGSTPASHDPNALIGPAGSGPQGYILSSGALSYTVDFENDGNAAAQDVTVSEQLDPNLNWSTFQLGSFGFGPETFTVPTGLTQYQTTIAYQNVDGTSLDVKVNLNFNVQTGLLSVTFASLDPLTGQAPNGVLDGFLPPNNSSGIGQGFVQYSVQPKAGLGSGTAIGGQASVVFDTNPAIATNTVKNTIDATPPSSSVHPLPATVNSPNFTVSWSASDPNGPGIMTYSVYVSDNGGAFTPWMLDTTQTSATYNGQVGHHYSFYSVAVDNVGLRQPTPSGAQASTYVFVTSPPPPAPPPPHSPPAPPAPPTLQVPPLLAFFDSLLGGVETINANGTETITDKIFGIPLIVANFDGAGKLTDVTLFGIDVTFLFELL